MTTSIKAKLWNGSNQYSNNHINNVILSLKNCCYKCNDHRVNLLIIKDLLQSGFANKSVVVETAILMLCMV